MLLMIHRIRNKHQFTTPAAAIASYYTTTVQCITLLLKGNEEGSATGTSASLDSTLLWIGDKFQPTA